MKNKIFKGIFSFSRFCVRCFTAHYSVHDSKERISPVVYVVHHQNLKGPFVSVAWLRKPFRLWVLGVFCNRKSCYKQYYGYTFTKRFRMPKLLAAPLAYLSSFYIYALMKGMEAIPVYRGLKSIVSTFRESILTLKDGQNLLICPDIDYTNTSSSMGEMYNGFLDLDKYYMKETGSHLAFVPVHIGLKEHIIRVGNAVYFCSGGSFKQEKESTYVRIKQEFSRLEAMD